MTDSRRVSPPLLLLLFAVLSFVFSVAAEFLFPGDSEPLASFFLKWRFFHGVAGFVSLFPAVALAAVTGCFGFGDWEERGDSRFSPRFLESMKAPLLTAIGAAIAYAALFLFLQPIARDSIADMRSKGVLFKTAAEKGAAAVKREDWKEAGGYLAICQKVWPDSPETADARDLLEIGLSSIRAEESRGRFAALTGKKATADFPGISAATTPTQALDMAGKALVAGRYFDAHWLATLAERIARPGAIEQASATRLAADAWNAIAAMEPSDADRKAFAVYKKKREGYAAVLAEDWIRAYFIYEELSRTERGDPDVERFLKVSETGTKTVSFFADEVGVSIGAVDLDAAFSLPGEGSGRDILRIKRLHPFADSSYGEGLEFLSFDASGNLKYGVEAPFVKAVPVRMDDSAQSPARTALLLLALDREDETVRWAPKWTGGNQPDGLDTRLLLAVPYDDFLLAVRARRGIEALSIPELNQGSAILANYGFIAESFRAEILRRFAEPFAFLSLSVFVLAIAWRSRAPKHMGPSGIPILILLPFAMDVLVQAYRQLATASATVFALALPFGAAAAAAVAFQGTLLLAALIFLAGQRS